MRGTEWTEGPSRAVLEVEWAEEARMTDLDVMAALIDLHSADQP